ncbi:MAG TPA: DNA-3-methyladenine glycosylase [Xanthobacteraceae bacterium]|nr:DNA-3-methyladenine glycosylase [Xanthobacteraceae bacterium]
MEKMSARIDTEVDLEAALVRLIEADPSLKTILAIAGPLPLRRRAGGFPGLASIVCSQQLSTASASAIWGRLEKAFSPFDHHNLLRARTPQLQRAGLSRAKIRTFRILARALRDGQLDLEALAELPADAAHTALVAHKGIGPWTADIYLMFCIGHADAFPAGDLALQEAARLAFRKKKRPTAKELERMAERWRPWRGVAARLLWTYYRAVKRRDPVPVQPQEKSGGGNGRTRRPATGTARGRPGARTRRLPARLRRRRK